MRLEREDVASIARGVRARDARALARAISWIEDADPRGGAVLGELPEGTPALAVGVTGSAGVGKSSVIAALIRPLREAGEKVAVLAVDPTSPKSGGALLGDRLRMRDAGGDADVYIRSLATRDGAGGIAAALPEAVELLERAGFDVILAETIGAGQLDTAVVAQSDMVLLLLSPESGDAVQFLKAGMAELVDQLVVNKCERPGAERMMSDAAELASDSGKPPPIAVSAELGTGIEALAARLLDRRRALAGRAPGERRERRVRGRLAALVRSAWLAECERRAGGAHAIDEAAKRVLAGQADLRSAAEELVQRSFRN